MSLVVTSLLNISILAHGAMVDHNADEYESPASGGTMLNLPIMVDFDGKITYGIGIMDHSSHGGHSNQGNHGGHDMGGYDMGGHDMGGHDMGGNDMGGNDMGGHDMGGSDMGGNDMGGHDMGGNDMSGNDMGDMNGDHNMNGDNHNNTMNHPTQKKIMWHIMPMIHVGGDFNKRVVSTEIEKEAKYLLQPSSFHSTYLSIINKRLEGGAGLMLMGMPTSIDWGGFFQIGFMPYKGSYYFSKSSHINHGRALNASPLKIPRTLDQLASWKAGDKVTTSTHGGIMMGAGIGATIFTDISANYMLQGTWRIELEKLTDSKVKVVFTEMDLKHVMMNFGATIISSNIGKHKVKSVALEYTFDLAKNSALVAYNNALQGDFEFADKLLTREIDGVVDLSKTESLNTGVMSQTKIGLPILFNRNSMKMTTKTTTSTTDLTNGSKANTIMNMVHNEINTDGVWSQHKKNFSMYMGSTNTVKDFTYKTASFVWHYERDNSSPKKLNKVLAKWNKSLGLNSLKEFKAYTNKLGHTRATLNLVLSQAALDRLTKLSQGKITSYAKKLLRKPELFRNYLKSLNKEDLTTTLKVQTEYFNTVNFKY